MEGFYCFEWLKGLSVRCSKPSGHVRFSLRSKSSVFAIFTQVTILSCLFVVSRSFVVCYVRCISTYHDEFRSIFRKMVILNYFSGSGFKCLFECHENLFILSFWFYELFVSYFANVIGKICHFWKMWESWIRSRIFFVYLFHNFYTCLSMLSGKGDVFGSKMYFKK